MCIRDRINTFIDQGKAVLGICYGHQMIAKAIAGDIACRKTKIPEFGWKKINILKPNPLFTNITSPVMIQSHYDEVCNLDERFDVVANTDVSDIQAFQLKNHKVWGVQFHPEMSYTQGCKMVIENLASEPNATEFLSNDAKNEDSVKQNEMIILNFLNQ